MDKAKLLALLVAALLALSAAGQSFAQENADLPASLRYRDQPDLHMIAVEALVVEINEERTRELGLQYGLNTLSLDEAGNTIDNAPSGVLDGGDIRLGSSLTPVSVPVLIKGVNGQNSVGYDTSRLPGLGISLVGMNVGAGVVSAKLRTLLNTGDASIRTRPIAVARHGQAVEIRSTDQVPYQDIDANSKLSVSFSNVGVTMKVTPTIEELRTNRVHLMIENLEVSSISNYLTQQNVERPVFNKSATHTEITLCDGETFVVGGLKTHYKGKYQEKVPILGSIPLIKYLFMSQSDTERNMDVLFFITPHVLAPGQNFLLPYDFRNQEALGLHVNASVAKH